MKGQPDLNSDDGRDLDALLLFYGFLQRFQNRYRLEHGFSCLIGFARLEHLAECLRAGEVKVVVEWYCAFQAAFFRDYRDMKCRMAFR